MTARANTPKPVFDRVPPQNIEAERSVLGAMLLNPDAVHPAVTVLGESPADVFYVEAHQALYGAILDMTRDRTPVDSLTLMERLNRNGTLETAGGVAYIAGLTSAVPTSANIEHYARIVREHATRRAMIALAAQVSAACFRGEQSADDVAEAFTTQMIALVQGNGATDFATVADGLEGVFERIEALYRNQATGGILLGLRNIDGLLRGLRAKGLYILAARPAVGKTGLALTIANNVAASGKNVLVFSLEMGREELEDRIAFSIGQLDRERLLDQRIAEDDLGARCRKVAQAAHLARIFLDDSSRLTALRLRSRARAFAAKRKIDLIVVDYLQLLSGNDARKSRREQVEELSREMKILARELDCPVLALSQLNRSAAGEGVEPEAHQLKESGSIEQDADAVLLL